MRVVRIMANLNPGGCDVPPCAPTSVRGRFEFNSQILALSGLEEYYKCTEMLKAAVEIIQYPLQISITEVSHELDAGQLPHFMHCSIRMT